MHKHSVKQYTFDLCNIFYDSNASLEVAIQEFHTQPKSYNVPEAVERDGKLFTYILVDFIYCSTFSPALLICLLVMPHVVSILIG